MLLILWIDVSSPHPSLTLAILSVTVICHIRKPITLLAGLCQVHRLIILVSEIQFLLPELSFIPRLLAGESRSAIKEAVKLNIFLTHPCQLILS
jgi:hypothetical protein